MTEPKKRITSAADRAKAREAKLARDAADPKKNGRPTSFTPEVQDEILRRLEAGETLMGICRDAHLPEDWSVRRYARANPSFGAALARAREAWSDAQADVILSIIDDSSKDWVEHSYGGKTTLKPDREAIDRSKARVDTRKWLMARFAKRVYSDDATKLDPTSPGDAAELIKSDATIIAPDEPGPKDPIV